MDSTKGTAQQRITITLDRAQGRMVSIGCMDTMRTLDSRITWKGRPWGNGTIIRCNLAAAIALVLEMRQSDMQAAGDVAQAVMLAKRAGEQAG